MKLQRYFLGKLTSLVGLIVLFAVCMVQAQPSAAEKHGGFSRSHQAGIRLGVWNNMGDLPPKEDSMGGARYAADIKDASFYFEGFFAYRVSPAFMIEGALGIVNRGDVTVEDSFGDSYVGGLTLYPIQLKAKFYPLGDSHGKMFPYLAAGAGIYHGRHDIQFTSDPFVVSGNSKTSFSYLLGGGLDYQVADVVGLDLNVNYLPVKFSDDLFEVKDYQALTVTVGVKYLFQSPKK